METKTHFKLMLEKAKSNQSNQFLTTNTINSTPKPAKDPFLQVVKSLPSEISLPKPKPVAVKETVSKIEKKSKSPSFNQLMKMAKSLKPDGLSLIKRQEPPIVSSTLKKNRESLSSRIVSDNRKSSAISHHGTPKKASPISKKPSSQSNFVYINSRGKVNGKGSSKVEFIKASTTIRDRATMEEILNEKFEKKGIPTKHPSLSPKAAQNPVSTKTAPVYQKLESRSVSKRPRVEPRNNYSSVISSMFGYDRSRYNDEFSDDDMEVGFNDLEKEERKSSKIAKKEDAEEERKLLEKERKKLLKRKP